MKSLELQPIPKNIKDTFIKDSIGRNEDIFAFIEMLSTLEENYSIALDGQWGSGKTFFIKQTIMLIDAAYGGSFSDFTEDEQESIRSLIPQEQVNSVKKNFAIYFDAWENDNDDDPLLSLVCTIVEKHSVNFANSRSLTDILFGIANVIGSSPLTETFTCGLIGVRTVSYVKEVKDAVVGEDLLKNIKKAKDIKGRVDEFFNALAESKESERIVIFIDELDRCKPSYAVKLLERIKHYMTHPNITFVFSTNLSELSCTVKKCYGTDFNGHRYLDRFFDFRVRLPHINNELIFNELSLTTCHYVRDLSILLTGKLNFSIRESIKFTQHVNFAFKNAIQLKGERENKEFNLLLSIMIPTMAALKIYNTSQYNQFVAGQGIQVLKNIFEDNIFNKFNSLFREKNTTYANNPPNFITFYRDMWRVDIWDEHDVSKVGNFILRPMYKDYILKIDTLLCKLID